MKIRFTQETILWIQSFKADMPSSSHCYTRLISSGLTVILQTSRALCRKLTHTHSLTPMCMYSVHVCVQVSDSRAHGIRSSVSACRIRVHITIIYRAKRCIQNDTEVAGVQNMGGGKGDP